MRKLPVITVLFLLVCSIPAFAVDCTDSDSGGTEPEPYIGEKASVTYGLTEKFDECVSGKDGYHLATSPWVREYYCITENDLVLRKYKDYDCTRYGYTKCEDGKCIGKAGTGANATKVKTVEAPRCGDHKVDAGEQCDPPDKICYDDSGNIGQCTKPNAKGFGGCQCKILGSTAKVEETNTTVAPVTTTTTPPATPPPATTTPPAAVQPPAPTTPPAEQAPEDRAPLPTEDLDSSNGVGMTRGISNAVKRFFSWIGSWFG